MPSRSVLGSSALSLPLMAMAVAAGIAAGLLLAPANGSTTRARLRGRAVETGSRLRRSAASMYERLQQRRLTNPLRRQGEAPEPPLTATIGEITTTSQSSNWGAMS